MHGRTLPVPYVADLVDRHPMAIIQFDKASEAVPCVFLYDSFVSDRYGVAYLCVPKVLSRSMLDYLSGIDPDGYEVGTRNRGKEVLLSGTAQPPRTFTFVRNPYSRAVAFYYHMFKNFSPKYHGIFGQRGLSPEMTFPEFVDWLATDAGSDRYADPHFLSQTYFLLDAGGDPAVDFVGRMEDVAEDLPDIQGRLGLPRAELPRRNTNANRTGTSFDSAQRWREVLDDRSIRVLTNRYDADFELLGYPRLKYKVLPFFPREHSPTPSAHSAVRSAERKMSLRRLLVDVVNAALRPIGLELQRRRRKSRS
jgi:chondroitin 4-sulfotransferase 11